MNVAVTDLTVGTTIVVPSGKYSTTTGTVEAISIGAKLVTLKLRTPSRSLWTRRYPRTGYDSRVSVVAS